jgi:uncharacterized protein (TIGR03435 family)
MTDWDDYQLLAECAAKNSEAAFAALVERHVGLVYSTAFRSVGNAHAAEEITQAVFIILARKAENFSPKIILSGWLYQTARLTAANFLRGEIRRQQRETEAYMQSTLNEPDANAWRQIAPLLDDALGKLGEADRNAIVLRFFENKNLREVGNAMGASEDAAKMRVNRALEKLRKIFSKRGVALSATLIAGAVSANSVSAAPLGLAATVTAAAAKGAAVSGSTLTLIKGALKIMAWTKMKTAIVVGVGVLLAAGTTVITVKEIQNHRTYPWQVFNPRDADSIMNITPPQVNVVPTKFPLGDTKTGGDSWSWTAIRENGKILGMNCTAGEIMRYAYSADADFFSHARFLMETNLSNQCYDFIANTKSGAQVGLQLAMKKNFGLVGKFETRTVEALALKAGTNHNGQNTGAILKGTVNIGEGESGLTHITSMSELTKRIDAWMKVPVVDQTGLNNQFDLTVRWTTTSGSSGDALKIILLDQLGLELVPSREPVEMLVVEKVK